MASAAGEIQRISVESGGAQADSLSFAASASQDANVVAFDSWASNLSAGDADELGDTFVHDRRTGTTTLASAGLGGSPANDESWGAVVAANGRRVVFASYASNLVAGDTNDSSDVFLLDLPTSEIIRLSVTSEGGQSNADSYDPVISADGSRIAFTSDAPLDEMDVNQYSDVYVRDVDTDRTTIASLGVLSVPGNGDSYATDISADGHTVVFESDADNLHWADENEWTDVFVRLANSGLRVASDSHIATASNGPSFEGTVSADGRFVAFSSWADNLLAGDSNDSADIFVWEAGTGQLTRASLGPAGAQPDDASFAPSLSARGRYVAFDSYASNLVLGDFNLSSDVFVKDLGTGAVVRASTSESGGPANDESYYPSLASDGTAVAFESWANNLVAGDSNGEMDVFVKQLPTAEAAAEPTTTTIFGTGHRIVESGEESTFRARLRSAAGIDLTTRKVWFVLRNGEAELNRVLGRYNADFDSFEATIRLDLPAGQYVVDAVFEGDPVYAGSSDTELVGVSLREGSIRYQGPGIVTRGQRVTLTGVLTDAKTGRPIPGRRVNFELWVFDGWTTRIERWSAVSAADGRAVVEMNVKQLRGVHTLNLETDTDDFYLGSRIQVPLEVRWEYAYEDQSGQGFVYLNPSTHEFEWERVRWFVTTGPREDPNMEVTRFPDARRIVRVNYVGEDLTAEGLFELESPTFLMTVSQPGNTITLLQGGTPAALPHL